MNRLVCTAQPAWVRRHIGPLRSDPISPVDQIRFHPDLPEASRNQILDRLSSESLDSNDRAEIAAAFSTLDLCSKELNLCGKFVKGTYERAEIARCDEWVLLALLWDDCCTEIHDHDTSECGFQIMQGEILETRYAIVSGTTVRQVAKRSLLPGQKVSSNRSAIHRLATLPGQRAMSLHAYSPALDIDSMNVYTQV